MQLFRYIHLNLLYCFKVFRSVLQTVNFQLVKGGKCSNCSKVFHYFVKHPVGSYNQQED